MNVGVACAALAFVSWGLYPLYFRQLAAVGAGEVLVHRVLWSLAFLLVLLAVRRRWAWLAQVARRPRVLAAFCASAVLLSINWVTYIWSVGNGHVVDASLGYFMTPLVNVALGYTVLHERLRRAQGLALSLAALGVAWLTFQAGQLPWIALVLASSFGAYGLLRKIASLGALEGLTLETMILLPAALAGLFVLERHGSASFPSPDLATNLWLIGVGPVTAVPLLLFAAGARRLSLAPLGLVQYLSPTMQFGLGVWIFHEPFSALRLIGFGLIWTALLLYSLDGWRNSRRAAGPALAPTL
ncbi:MAG TPA: EamA family transporter RarD [Caldimonas sp.]